MKRATLVMGGLLLALVRPAQADFVQSFNFSGGLIPDGSEVGRAFTGSVSGMPGSITDVNVTLNLSGGWNGDLYAYLVYNSGFAVLLNRVGRETGNETGYGDAGMNVKLDDQATRSYDLHFYREQTGYVSTDIQGGEAWKPDGRNISPLDTVGDFDTATRTALLSSFNGVNPNGNWTLFMADLSGGDQSTLTSWTLEIAAVPEPGSLLQGAVAALFLGGVIAVYRLKGPKAHRRPC